MERREFLEVTAAVAGATRLAAPFAGVRVPPSDTVRFGMIGVGMQGSGLLGDAIALPGVTCAAAADLYDGRHALAKEIAGPNLPATREYRRRHWALAASIACLALAEVSGGGAA